MDILIGVVLVLLVFVLYVWNKKPDASSTFSQPKFNIEEERRAIILASKLAMLKQAAENAAALSANANEAVKKAKAAVEAERKSNRVRNKTIIEYKKALSVARNAANEANRAAKAVVSVEKEYKKAVAVAAAARVAFEQRMRNNSQLLQTNFMAENIITPMTPMSISAAQVSISPTPIGITQSLSAASTSNSISTVSDSTGMLQMISTSVTPSPLVETRMPGTNERVLVAIDSEKPVIKPMELVDGVSASDANLQPSR